MHTRFTSFTAPAAAAAGLLLAAGSAPAQFDGYMKHADLSAAVNGLAEEFDACTLVELAASGGGRGLYLLTLSGDAESAGERPALLITAGLDGRHLVGTETAVRVARNLLENHADLLDDMTVYVIPRANPDGAEANLGEVNAGHIGTFTVVDADRDGVADEDGPNDLNGDGVITQMRRPDPPLDDTATHMADPAEPRLLKTPDAMKGESAMYSLYTEGVDDDGDGLIAEDGPGMVDLDKNFMKDWPEHDVDSGTYQLAEVESHALAQFVLEHRNIVAAIVYGRHDTVVNPPDGKGKDITGRAPKNIDPDDVALYREVSDLYKEITGQSNAPREDSAGSFHAWLYAQRGIPTFATVVWERPGEAKEEKKPESPRPGAAEGPAGPDGSWAGTIDIPDMGSLDFTLDIETAPDGSATAMLSSAMFSLELTGSFDAGSGLLDLGGSVGGPEGEGGGASISGTFDGDSFTGTATGPDGNSTPMTATLQGAGGSGGGNGGKASDADGAAWLKYSDEQRDGAGFVDWTEFDHPTLGRVEIGGFVPGFTMNPPAGELDGLAEKQAEFAVALMGKRPKLEIEGPDVTKLASGLYEVRFGIVNEGFLPTTTAMARMARSVLPTIIELSVPVEQIVSGERINRVWGIDGSGSREALHWIVRVADNSEVSIKIRNEQLGDRSVTFTAE